MSGINFGIGRRQFVVAAAATGLALVAAPASITRFAVAAESGVTFTPGTYTASAMGRKGPIGVEVTFSDTAIESVEVVESHETPRIAASAFAQIPATVVEYQTLGVDAVTGATLSSMGLIGAIEDCVEQAGGDLKALRAVPGPQPKDTEEELDCDVLVIGSGSSGTVCAMECAMRGAKVVVMEKSSNIGGNALVCGGVLNWCNPPEEVRAEMNDGLRGYFEQTLDQAVADFGCPQEFADQVRAQFDEYYASGSTKVFDSPEWGYLYGLVSSADGTFSQEGYESMVGQYAGVEALFGWLNQTDIEWKTPLVGVAGYPWPSCTSPVEGECGAGYFLAFDRYIDSESLPVDFLLATPAQELIVEDGKAAGAKGVCADGTRYTVHASKAVVLATGGFSGSPELLKKYGAEWDFASMDYIPTDNAYGHTGDGLALSMQAGAGEPAEKGVYVMILPHANAVDQSVESIVGNSGNALLVNKEGVRFVDEAQGRNFITRAEMQQTDQMCYLISDAAGSLIANGMNMFGIEEESLLAQGKCFKDETIEGLAAQIGLDPDALAQTVATFNSYAADGADPDFGRTMFNEASLVTEPPFYACPCRWAVHITDALVATGLDGSVLDAAGNPVPGLYAIGELGGWAGITNMTQGMLVADMIMA